MSVPRSFPVSGFYILVLIAVHQIFLTKPFSIATMVIVIFCINGGIPMIDRPYEIADAHTHIFPQKIAEKAAHSIADFYKVNAGDVGTVDILSGS